MSHAELLKELLRPLRIYQLDGGLSGGELQAQGLALDGCLEELEETQREMNLTTAEDFGLENIESLLAHCPVTTDLTWRREALAALLRVSGDGFTLDALNDTICGCGLNAVVSEGDAVGTVEVRFPDVPGVPEGFETMKIIIEDILPCHLLISYIYWFVTWGMLEEREMTWEEIQQQNLTWSELVELVE